MLGRMSDLSSTVGVLALAALAVAVLALLLCGILALRLRRLRAAQRVVLGEQGSEDLVVHAAGLQQAFHALHDYAEELAAGLNERMGKAERRLDGSISHRALVRYDAYNEMSGHQSTTIALLDSSRSGIVLSSIHHRDQARLYAKQVRDGKAELELSPEEAEAVRIALGAEPDGPKPA